MRKILPGLLVLIALLALPLASFGQKSPAKAAPDCSEGEEQVTILTKKFPCPAVKGKKQPPLTVQVRVTPDVETIRVFAWNRDINPGRNDVVKAPLDRESPDYIKAHPVSRKLAAALLAVEGIRNVTVSGKIVMVEIRPEYGWDGGLKPISEEVIRIVSSTLLPKEKPATLAQR